MPDQSSKPQRPKGEALRWTDEDISKLAEVGEEDLPAARAFYRRTAPAEAKDLLDATADDDQNGK